MNDFIEQSTPAWLKSRLGRLNASRAPDMMDKTQKGIDGAKRIGLRREIIYERLTNRAIERFVTKAMQHGIDTQPEAERVYSLITGRDVYPAPYVPHPVIAMSGASPDGFVGTDGLLEIKCPESTTHLQTLLSGEVPAAYAHQINFQMSCTGRAFCDFVSFDPRLPPELQIFIRRVERDNAVIEKLEAEVIAFLATVEDDLATLARYHAPV
jgi:putative phage-type endonuclease